MRVRVPSFAPSFAPCETTGVGGSVSSHSCHLGLGAKVSHPNPSDTPDQRRSDVLDTGRVPLAADVSEIGTYRSALPAPNPSHHCEQQRTNGRPISGGVVHSGAR